MGINTTKHRAFEHLVSTRKDSLSYENHVEDLFLGDFFLLLRSNEAVFYRRLVFFLAHSVMVIAELFCCFSFHCKVPMCI